MPHAFGRSRRLRRHPEFVLAQRGGRRVSTAHFILLVSARAATASGTAEVSQPGPARLGVVVSRKIGGAVQRNRVKRLCRECFRTWPDLLPGGIDLVIIARAGAADLDLARVRGEWAAVERFLKKRAVEALAQAASPHHPPRGQ